MRLRATVLYFDPEWKACWLIESGEILFVETEARASSIPAGNLVELFGRTTRNGNETKLEGVTLAFIGRGCFPPPIALAPDQLQGDRPGPPWGKITGTVRKVKNEEGNPLQLILRVGSKWGASLNITLPVRLATTI